MGHVGDPGCGSNPAPHTSIWWRFSALGAAFALYVFMADSFHAVSQGVTVSGNGNFHRFQLAAVRPRRHIDGGARCELAWRMMLSPGRRTLTS